MSKKKIVIAIVGLLCIGIIAGGYFVSNYTSKESQKIDPSKKVVLSDEAAAMLSRLGMPSLEFYAQLDQRGVMKVYVVEGDIVEEEEWTHPLFANEDTNEAMHNKYGSGLTATETMYTIKLDKVWYGDISESETEIKAWIGGRKGEKITKPNMGDKVVLFLYVQNGRFTALDMEHGIFTVNENGELYAFSNTEELSQYDGESVETMMEDFYEEVSKAAESQ